MSARISPVDVASAEGRTQELFANIKSRFGKVPNTMKTMAHSPAVLEGYLAFAGALAQGTLPAKLREQLALTVGQFNNCEYCVSAHTLTGKLAGLTADEVVAARHGEATDPKSQAALELALTILNQRGEVPEEDFAAARQAGLDDAEIAEVVAHVALNTFTNYFNQTVQTEVDFPRVSLEFAAQ
ncbi:MAG: carboxymuconolactone decarboxylase family protein [Planctomycetaceae bacterium]